MGPNQIYKLCIGKEAINKKPTEWEKIFANDVTNKGLIFKIYKQVMWINIKKKSKNRQKTQTDIFSKKIYRWPVGT